VPHHRKERQEYSFQAGYAVERAPWGSIGDAGSIAHLHGTPDSTGSRCGSEAPNGHFSGFLPDAASRRRIVLGGINPGAAARYDADQHFVATGFHSGVNPAHVDLRDVPGNARGVLHRKPTAAAPPGWQLQPRPVQVPDSFLEQGYLEVAQMVGSGRPLISSRWCQ